MCDLFSLFVSDFIMSHVVLILFVELIIWLFYLTLFASVITLDIILLGWYHYCPYKVNKIVFYEYRKFLYPLLSIV
jgi:hypothetical protein